ncbi:hypothetical protein [Leucobacter sp. 1207-22]|uniref:hypothetical protein n=1 Tax=Leucobacter sp. 1207-22 TaxID=2604456 RepID=UPI0040646513
MNAHAARAPRRGKGLLVGSLAFALGIAVTAGATFALWSQQAGASGSARTGFESFAAGTAGAVTPAESGKVSFAIGKDAAKTLLEKKAVAIPFETASVSQGNKGLTYDITAPNWGTGIFGASQLVLVSVPNAAGCTVSAAEKAGGYAFTTGSAPVRSTTVTADYSTSTSPVIEHWCLVATLGDVPGSGSYTNTATVTGTDPAGAQVQASDDWTAQVLGNVDLDAESQHKISLTYQTFRPGQENQ